MKNVISEESWKLKIMVEYSKPNMENIRRSHLYPEYSSHLLYVPPLMYPCFRYSETHVRTIDVLSTFIYPGGRRQELLDRLIDNKDVNVNNVWGWEQSHELYSKTKILINMHQSPSWHTFEEIRVLPAILCGTIVVAERSPLLESIPYHDLIIWGSVEEIPALVHSTLMNYKATHRKLYGPESGFVDRMRELAERTKAEARELAHDLVVAEKNRQKRVATGTDFKLD